MIKILIIFNFLLCLNQSNDILSNWECGSDFDISNNALAITNTNREGNKAVIRSQIWEIHRSDSLFEMGENAIENGFQRLIDVYKEHGILFNISNRDIIYSDSLYYFAYNQRPFELMTSHSIDNMMNFFYLPNIDYTGGTLTGYGQAFDIGGNELMVAGYECQYVGNNQECYDLADTFIPIHEAGHCLGLYHTHSNTYGDEHVIRLEDEEPGNCEVNCTSAADFLCDTEASLSLKNDVMYNGDSCSYTLTESDSCGYVYEPQLDNFMSYTHFECGSSFTPDQVDRMFYYIENNNSVRQTIIPQGDLNDDSQINVLDIVLIVDAILMGEDILDINLWLGDLNEDGLVNILDVVIIVNIILD